MSMTPLDRILPCVALVVAPAIGCRTGTAPERGTQQPAVIDFYGGAVQVTVPDTVTAGADFVVVALSYGDGCLAKGRTEVAVAGLVADVRPYDYVPPEGTTCTRPLLTARHEAVVRFATPGRALVRVHGRQRPGDGRVTVERTTIVR